ncbi:uncharacterized protein LOC8276660 [Ricinus communis]|uniref:LysM domain-containing protein n=1 Tax=Ricinus communis TaxID=3988 RepID=B9S4K1_RICCO|nr:uncharacterized protein LOC8276660 [Ricinus communis]EEF41465.1 conserved hypothetical protein [Ricinus communis]|eukprot:XP_002520920.1 uncharacterized protein LOC8276660 [Ricinus communis]
MDSEMVNYSNGNHHCNYNYKNSTEFCNDYYKNEDEEVDPLPISRDHGYDTVKSRFLMSPTNFYPFSSATKEPSSPARRHDFIEHPVSRMDTLAGVAIKYGVEVADIKKMNGLVTDLQMFALKSLQIPLPGKHPPSSSLSNGHDTSRKQAPTYRAHSDLFDSFQSLRLNSSKQEVSPAMTTLQGYYGLKPLTDPMISNFETVDYRKGDCNYQDDIQYLRPSPSLDTPLNRHRKSRSLVNGFLEEHNRLADNQHSTEARENNLEKWNEKLVRRRQKSEADFSSIYPETLMREDSCVVSSPTTGKSLAMRFKAARRTGLPIDTEINSLTDSFMNSAFASVRKSSSTSSLQDQESSSSSIRAASKWSLKPDLQALSTSGITKPMFDGLPKPITSRRNKAALD